VSLYAPYAVQQLYDKGMTRPEQSPFNAVRWLWRGQSRYAPYAVLGRRYGHCGTVCKFLDNNRTYGIFYLMISIGQMSYI